jgi:hypothetical protein
MPSPRWPYSRASARVCVRVCAGLCVCLLACSWLVLGSVLSSTLLSYWKIAKATRLHCSLRTMSLTREQGKRRAFILPRLAMPHLIVSAVAAQRRQERPRRRSLMPRRIAL